MGHSILVVKNKNVILFEFDFLVLIGLMIREVNSNSQNYPDLVWYVEDWEKQFCAGVGCSNLATDEFAASAVIRKQFLDLLTMIDQMLLKRGPRTPIAEIEPFFKDSGCEFEDDAYCENDDVHYVILKIRTLFEDEN